MNISFDPTFWRTAEIGEIIAQFFILAFVMLAVFFIFGLIARAWLMWRRSLYRKSVSFITYAIDIPPEEIKTPKAMENLISQLYAIKSKFNTFEKWWKGQYTLQTSLEIIAQDGYVQFCAYVPHKYEYLFKKAVYAQFSDAHISEIEDYAKAILTDDLISSNPAGRYDSWNSFLQDIFLVYQIKNDCFVFLFGCVLFCFFVLDFHQPPFAGSHKGVGAGQLVKRFLGVCKAHIQTRQKPISPDRLKQLGSAPGYKIRCGDSPSLRPKILKLAQR